MCDKSVWTDVYYISNITGLYIARSDDCPDHHQILHVTSCDTVDCNDMFVRPENAKKEVVHLFS